MNKAKTPVLAICAIAAAGLLAACERKTTVTDTTTGTTSTTTTTPSMSASTPMSTTTMTPSTTTTTTPSTTTSSMTSSMSSAASSVGMAIGDAAITAKVKTSLLADDNVKGLRIDVDTKDGIVTLNGTADNSGNMDKAATLARQVDGVKSVDNRLTVKP